jgi:hypothetical protein
MIHKILVYFHENRYRILMIIAGIVIFLLLIHGLNAIVINNNKKLAENMANSYKDNNINNSSSNSSSTTIIENTSFSISNSTSSGKQLQSEQEIIEQFLTYCNENQIEKAYKLLSEDCKEELYSTISKFRENYYNVKFQEKLNFEVNTWDENTYKINMTQDILSTGKVSGDSTKRQEYITVVKESEGYKLNINNYIGKVNINRESESENVKVTVKYKKVYKDYEEYTILVNNKSTNNVLLNELKDLKTICIVNNKGIKNNAAMSEIIQSQIYVKPGEIKEANIKFYKNYKSNNIVKSFKLDNIILNCDNIENSKKTNIDIDL